MPPRHLSILLGLLWLTTTLLVAPHTLQAQRLPDEPFVPRIGETPADDTEARDEVAPTIDELEAAEQARDEQAEERLRTIFSHIDELDGVSVRVDSGVVQLSGEVPGLDAIRRAEELAAKLDGVVYVDNDLEEAREFSRRIEPTLDRLVEFGEAIIIYLPLVLVALVLLGLFWVLAEGLERLDFLYRRLSDRPLIQNIARQLVSTVVFLVGVVLVLELFDITSLVGAVLGTAGVAGLALGFAFRDIGENYLASIVLSLRRPFAHNDWVQVGEHEGKVVRLTTRDTVLMTLDGNHLRIPNAVVFKSIIQNFTHNPRRRFTVTAGVSVEEDLVEVRRIGLAALNDMEGVLTEPPPFARVEELGDSNVVVSFLGWVDQRGYDYLNVRSEAIHLVKSALDSADIEMPEPIYRINLHDLDKERGEARVRPTRIKHAPPEVVNLEADAEIDDQIDQDRRQSEESDLLEE